MSHSGLSERDCECACWARKAFASSASNNSGGRHPFSISDFRLGGDGRSSLGEKVKKDVRIMAPNPMPSVPNASVPYVTWQIQ